MFLFLRLVLGHFIGDFILQTNKIYELKHRSLRGGLPHALFITASYIAVSWPYLALLHGKCFLNSSGGRDYLTVRRYDGMTIQG
ncbi:MAG: DUF3307 domain-containing protein [Candidatus Omnitrophica bacterium]|nr:DUF3307 domain-containing protein [Candidatus Omnitrophota bacterium]